MSLLGSVVYAKTRQFHVQAAVDLLFRRDFDHAVLRKTHPPQHPLLRDAQRGQPAEAMPFIGVIAALRGINRPLGPAPDFAFDAVAEALHADEGMASLDLQPALPQLHADIRGVRQTEVVIRPPILMRPVLRRPVLRRLVLRRNRGVEAACTAHPGPRKPSSGCRTGGGKAAVEKPAHLPRDQWQPAGSCTMPGSPPKMMPERG